MAGKRVVLVVLLGAAAAAVWVGVRRHQTAPAAGEPEAVGGGDAQKFIGKWTFVEGTMKSDWDFQGTAQKHEVSLAGKSLTMTQREGGLWATLEGDPCSILLARKAGNAAELVSARTVCPEPAAGAAKKEAKSIDMAVSMDASGRGHVTGTSKFSLETGGEVHAGRLEFAGVVQQQADAGQ
jgi:hypothetical protein